MNSKKNAILAIHQLLENGSEADRCSSCRALGILQDNNNIENISQHLKDDDIDVCIDAATALGQIAHPEAIPFLLESLQQDPDGEVRTAVIEALGNINDDRVTPVLLSVLNERPENLEWDDNWDPWWDMQLKAVTALGMLRVKNAVPVILKMLGDDEYQDIESELLKALAQISGVGITALMKHFTHGNSRVRRRVMIALRFSAQKQIGRELAKGIRDSEADVRIATIQTLAELNAKHFLGALFLLIKDSDADVRTSAIEAIFRITRDAGKPDIKHEGYDLTNNHLMALLDDVNSRVRYMAATVLLNFDKNSFSDPACQKIITKLSDTNPGVAITVCKLLGHLKNEQAISPLLEILSDNTKESGLRQQAALALGNIELNEQHTISVLVDNITDQHQIVRLAALTALNKIDQQQNNQTTNQSNDIAFNAIIQTLKAKPESMEQQKTQKTHNRELDNTIENSPGSQNKIVTSTLDAIARDNVVIALSLQQSTNQTDKKPEIHLENNDPALKEFVDIVKQNNDTGEWLRTKKSSDKTLIIENDVRYLAARILANSERPDAITILIETLRDSDAELRRESAMSLAQIATRNPKANGIQNSFGSLMLQLETGTFEIRLACIRALGALVNSEAIPAIMESLTDENSAVRIESIIALRDLFFSSQQSVTGHQTIDTKQVIENIIEKLEDASSGVRMNAASVLLNIVNQNIILKKSFSDNIISKIVTAAFKGDGGQARHMASVLREINIESATNKIIPKLKTLEDSSERRFAIEILEELFKPTPNKQNNPITERAA